MHGVAASYRNVATALYYKRESNRARELLEKSLELARELGDRVSEGYGLIVLANVNFADGQYARASALYRQSLELRYDLRHTIGMIGCIIVRN